MLKICKTTYSIICQICIIRKKKCQKKCKNAKIYAKTKCITCKTMPYVTNMQIKNANLKHAKYGIQMQYAADSEYVSFLICWCSPPGPQKRNHCNILVVTEHISKPMYHYYFIIVRISFSNISHYIRVLHPNFQELANANSWNTPIFEISVQERQQSFGRPGKFALRSHVNIFSWTNTIIRIICCIIPIILNVWPGFSSL